MHHHLHRRHHLRKKVSFLKFHSHRSLRVVVMYVLFSVLLGTSIYILVFRYFSQTTVVSLLVCQCSKKMERQMSKLGRGEGEWREKAKIHGMKNGFVCLERTLKQSASAWVVFDEEAKLQILHNVKSYNFKKLCK